MTVRFRSWHSYWNFEQAVRQRARYIHDPETEAFKRAVTATLKTRIRTIPKKTILWRAQLGHDWRPMYQGRDHIGYTPDAHPPSRMVPPQWRATEGRANPKGIPCLYLSNDRDTAMAEARPWVGSSISISQFRVRRKLQVVYCKTEGQPHVRLELSEPTAEKREEAVWSDIDHAFSRPVEKSDDVADYAPTQILAELFKYRGFDGVAYRSSLGKGYNLALFDIEAAYPLNGCLFEAKAITFDFQPAGDWYSIRQPQSRKWAREE